MGVRCIIHADDPHNILQTIDNTYLDYGLRLTGQPVAINLWN